VVEAPGLRQGDQIAIDVSAAEDRPRFQDHRPRNFGTRFSRNAPVPSA
jgi:hypothetical protein